MERLRAQLEELLERMPDAQSVRDRLGELRSVYPFSEYEYVISHLLAAGRLTLDEYCQLRDEYIDRNLYLYLFEISAPRGFGEVWAHGHLRQLVPSLLRPTKKLDPAYSGQYDFFLPPNARVEVKASRAVDSESDEPLYVKALASDSQRPFDMNFQQIKPACCDIFVWIAVWRDQIKYWVIPSFAVESSPYYSSHMHRGSVGEGQLHLNRRNMPHFDEYLAPSNQLEPALREAFEKDCQARGKAKP